MWQSAESASLICGLPALLVVIPHGFHPSAWRLNPGQAAQLGQRPAVRGFRPLLDSSCVQCSIRLSTVKRVRNLRANHVNERVMPPLTTTRRCGSLILTVVHLTYAGAIFPAHAQNTPTNQAAAVPTWTISRAQAAERLARAYPGALERGDDQQIRWRDGSLLAPAIPKGSPQPPPPDAPSGWLTSPDLRAIFQEPYPVGAKFTAPPTADPGRNRPQWFFLKLYGDCRSGAARDDLVDIAWLPSKRGPKSKLRMSRRFGIAQRVAAISTALDQLPARFDRFLYPPGGGFACRTIAGTNRLSAHAYGIAIDIAVKPSDYWRWSRADRNAPPAYRNRIPGAIVEIFEAHGFIWGGKWRHFDTMHFEYRPELLPPTALLPNGTPLTKSE